jgi:xylulose-5-phosphate/fructose-6-phosphate phosphoketolase
MPYGSFRLLMARVRINAKPTTTDGSPTATADRLSAAELRNIDAYWRACNYLVARMIDLCANPLLHPRLKPEHIKRRLLGHRGASPGLSFTFIHLNAGSGQAAANG